MQMIAVDDVVYFQAEDKYTKVVTRDWRGADQEADQGAVRGARPGSVLADPSRDDRQSARDRARRTRLARPARDHAASRDPKSSPCRARSRIASRRCSGARDAAEGSPRQRMALEQSSRSRRSRPDTSSASDPICAARARRPRRRSVGEGPRSGGSRQELRLRRLARADTDARVKSAPFRRREWKACSRQSTPRGKRAARCRRQRRRQPSATPWRT